MADIFDYGYNKTLNKDVSYNTNTLMYDQFHDETQNQVSHLRTIAGNLRLYDAIVDKSGAGDYYSVSKALEDGKTRIYVRNGSYSEDFWNISSANTEIVGESFGGVIITFSNATQGIKIDANNANFSNLDLNGTQLTTVTIVGVTSDKTGCSFDHCIFDDAKTYFVDAFTNGTNGSQINFTECQFDGAAMDTGTAALRGLYLSTVKGCKIDLDTGGTLESVLLDRPRGVVVTGCSITANYLTLATNVGTLAVVSNNIINARNIFCATTNLTGNYIFANADPGGVSATRKLFVVDGASRVSGNYFEMNYASRKIFDIGNFTMVSGNIFIGGSTADITGEGVSYSGNLWDTTAATNSTFTLTAASSRCIYGDSIIRGPSSGGGYTLTFTNAGTNNVISTDVNHYQRA